MNSLLGNLNIDPVALLINVVGFLLLLVIANNLVFKPIGRVIDTREEDVNATYDKIESERKQMEALREEYQTRLASIEAEAREKIQNAIKEAESARDQIMSETADRSRELVARAEREAEHERKEAMVTLRKQIVDLALGATAKIIGDGLDESRQRRLIDEFISAGGSTGPASVVATATPIAIVSDEAGTASVTEEAKPAARARRTTAKTASATDVPATDAPAAPEAEA